MAVKGNAKLIAAGEAVSDAVVITVTDLGAAKSTLIDELPTKGRGGSGVRLTKFKDDQHIGYAWIGLPERIVAIVGQANSPTKPDNSPESVGMKPTRRDGLGRVTPRRILAIGTLRW
jgi:DNA gyrase/topoisomerase IV subunit A